MTAGDILISIIGTSGTVLAAYVGKTVHAVKKQVQPSNGVPLAGIIESIQRNQTVALDALLEHLGDNERHN